MMIRRYLYLVIAFLLIAIGKVEAQEIHLVTPKNSLMLSAVKDSELKFIYYGNRLTDVDVNHLPEAIAASFAAYPVYGLNCPSESALAVVHADGNMTLQMLVEKVSVVENDDATMARITLKDKVYPFYVDACYKAYKNVDVIETWTEISHTEKKEVTLNRFASAYLPFRRGDVWISHLYGSWANEGNLMQEPLKAGVKMIKNKDGVRNSHTAHAEVMFSLDGKPQENVGNTIGAALCYSGNYKLSIDTDDSEYHH
ncbi:MAG: glycoside hydrolase family 36 N-terminal domain-containing protein, partial [Parabacteroides sp.]|nr:glycoside hydrolase family 36 N-terminal domain-containing protein [Parabacteroides sp.]